MDPTLFSAIRLFHFLGMAVWFASALSIGGDVRKTIARGKPHTLWLTFDTPTPAPTLTDIELDLSQALSSPAHPPLPPIRFVPRRWRVGYT